MLWDLGIIPELLFVVREIPKTRTRKTVIEFILESISLIRLLEIFEYLKDFNVFDWILEIIEEQLELGTDNHFEIVDCALFAISFYFQVFESIKGGDNLNAAKCKFNHSNGRQLLQRF